MKSFEVKKIGDGSNTFTVYRNPNEELRQQISSFNVDRSFFEEWNGTRWEIGEAEDGEIRCTSGKNVKYFSHEEVDIFLEEKAEHERNQKFPAYKYFKDCFGVISNIVEYENYPWRLRIIDLIDASRFLSDDREIDTTGVNFYFNFFNYEFKGLGLDVRPSGNSLALFFTKDGDFINRDYNENLSYFTNEVISPTRMLETLKNKIMEKTQGKLERSKGKFFMDDCCIIPYNYAKEPDSKSIEFGVEIIPIRSDGKSYQLYSGYPIHKKPANVETSNFQELWEIVMNSLTPLQKCLVSDDFQQFQQFITD